MGLFKILSKSAQSEGRVGADDEVENGFVGELGYDQAYRRVLGTFAAFAIVLAVASPMAGELIIASYQIVYGGYWGLSWGWIIPSILFFPQALAIAELSSSMPINGANYWWTAALAPPSLSRPLSFVAGWVSVLQVVTSLASFAWASGTSLSTLIPRLQPQWVPTNVEVMAIAMGTTVLWGLLCFLRMERISSLFIVNCVIVLATTFALVIGLPISHSIKGLPWAKGSDVFGAYSNFSGWDRSVAVPFSFFAVAWTVTGWNSPTYVAEETHNARAVVPRAVLQTYLATAVLGFLVSLISAFCIPSIADAAEDESGLPLYTMLMSHWGTRGGAAFILLTTFNSMIGGSSYLFTTSGQVAAFARDGGLPFASKFAYVHPATNIPIYTSLLLVAGTLLILLFGLSTRASSIIFSLAVIAGLIIMAIPIALRLFAGERFVPGTFSMGRLSKLVHAWALLTLVYMVVMESFPADPSWTASTFNYNWVVAVAALVASIITWFFIGPKFKGVDPGHPNLRRNHAAGSNVDVLARIDTSADVNPNVKPAPATAIREVN